MTLATIEQIADMLNEAAAMDPRLFAMFDVMIPVANTIGLATPIELMAFNDKVAMASCLGILNSVYADTGKRIMLATENKDGTIRRRFIVSLSEIAERLPDVGSG